MSSLLCVSPSLSVIGVSWLSGDRPVTSLGQGIPRYGVLLDADVTKIVLRRSLSGGSFRARGNAIDLCLLILFLAGFLSL